eukprot:TRINITY_DN52280_c0_g1_i1.p1 TRINITY_DN52280_c0_g1~~TRINITY_DN52280_c0_g1_i1.p1  ORF type:complete len:903 (+),score=133.66 TRINITY_DN52280_c0_g1_i1:139-2847(+)
MECGFLGYFFLCTLVAGIPCVASLMLWSDMGYGDQVYKEFFADNVRNVALPVLGGIATTVFATLYLLDFYWPPDLDDQYFTLFDGDKCVGRSILAVGVLAFYGAALCSAKDYPGVPITCTVLLGPIFIAILRVLTRIGPSRQQLEFNSRVSRRLTSNLTKTLDSLQEYVGCENDSLNLFAGSMVAFLLLGVFTLLAWTLWALTRSLDLLSIDLSNKSKEMQYIRWISPLATGVAYVMFGLVVALRVQLAVPYDQSKRLLREMTDLRLRESPSEKKRRETRRRKTLAAMAIHLGKDDVILQAGFDELDEETQDDIAQEHEHNLQQVMRVLKICGCVFVLAIGSVWLAAQLVAGDSQLASLVLGFLGVGFAYFFVFVFVSFRRLISILGVELMQEPLFRLFLGLLQNDWLKAIFIFCFGPLLPLLLVLSVVNQLVRSCRGTRRADADKEQAEMMQHGKKLTMGKTSEIVVSVPQRSTLTQRIESYLQKMMEWNWISILMKLYILGVCMLLYTICPVFLNVFLAWLRQQLKSLHFAVIVVCVVLAGLTCFLLPPVPGVPVYIFTGLIVADTCPAGFEAGCVIAILTSFVMKLLACAMQQKGIGEVLGTSIRIRSQVGIHKPFIRAIESVLRKPGLTIGKVSILCGGPDWPTSVLAGVLRLPLLEMEIGTLPIIFFAGPCALVGAFYLKASESEVWQRIGTLMLSITVLIAGTLQLMAAYAVQNELDRNNWQLTKPLEQNIDLDWLDYRATEISKSKVIRWPDLPMALQVIVLLGAIGEVGIGQLFYWLSSICFGKFAVTDDISKLQVWTDGNSGLILLPGLLASAACVGIFLGYIILSRYLNSIRADTWSRAGQRLDALENTWKDKRRELAQSLESVTEKPPDWDDQATSLDPEAFDVASVLPTE